MGGTTSAPLVEVFSYKGKRYQVDATGTQLEVIDIEGDDGECDRLPPHFKHCKVMVIDSIKSGTGRSKVNDIYGKILGPIFKDIELEHEYIKTKTSTSIEELAMRFPRDPALLIFLSGDTSINEFVNGLNIEGNEKGGGQDATQLVIFPIPVGTGNSLLLSFEFDEVVVALKKLFSHDTSIKPLYTYEVKFPPGSYLTLENTKVRDLTTPLRFLVVLSWAFHAAIVADSDTPMLRKFGVARFKMAAMKNLASKEVYEATTSVNDTAIDITQYGYWLVTPARKFEKTFVILPDGDIMKDELYLVAFNKNQDILSIMNQVYDNGKHTTNENVIYRKLTREDKLDLQLDGGVSNSRFCVDGSIVNVPGSDSGSHVSVLFSGNHINGWDLFVVS
ncbi:uncharacterized protein KQ657_002936 [Scheffersomyces spartinae]|uniref:DAGKc domain-containing protein n=1 Tax=Scheffersomyces spartinae TaxID=45513 RepID=A0A9P8AGQ3_9ASCO|nr:uncharacterized protein KQ657_002936 [Scheffersomyces spartinae]KAG7191665.1 hypothetical protein KQ657_002936 [Scheffersomyces spartinae]